MGQKFEISVNKSQFDRLLESAAIEALGSLVNEFANVRWWWLADDTMIMDATTGLLWDAKPDTVNLFDISNGRKHCADKKVGGLITWRLATKEELKNVATDNSFPLRSGKEYALLAAWYWLVAGGRVDTEKGYWSENSSEPGRVLATTPLPQGKATLDNLAVAFAARNWSAKPNVQTDREISRFDQIYSLVRSHVLKRPELLNASAIQAMYSHLDYDSVRLPKLDLLRFTDQHQGLWEFYVPDGREANRARQTIALSQHVRARNPEKDIRKGYVAIDFGTSSTVVAFKEQGRDELLRIGLADFYKTPEPKHYENPTVLEFIDIQKLLTDWQSQAYRPLISWDTVRCSHEARENLRDNDTDVSVVGSVMERLKQWALRGGQHAVVSITDQDHGKEYLLPPLTESDPVKGTPLTVGSQYPLDPIELYAWFLGMTINWRTRGLFLRYFMTFPVKYSNEIKRKILSSFRRGLQRSLPDTLLSSPRFAEFSVEERASEPAAFAASALQTYGIEATEEGEAYAVFDFGGGTTDFDYGYYRLPTTQEEAEGAEHVLEHFSAEGDEFLGGENLLENMAYLVFCDSLDVCRSKQIAFTKPLDAADFPGSEVLIVRTQAAITNTTMLMSKLRPLWEKGERNNNSAGMLKLSLLNRHGKSEPCELTLNEDKLLAYLYERIRLGLKNFFIAMQQAFTNHVHNTMPQQIHILLAGNASHSRIVQAMFGIERDDYNDSEQALHEVILGDLAEIYAEDCPEFEIHSPLVSEQQNPYKPNAKTGVALGLLHLCPGESLLEINHASQENAESPFQFYIGAFVRNKFQVKLKRGTAYGGAWQELGMVREQIFNLGYTQAANALNNDLPRGDMQLTEEPLPFPAAENGHKVFARPCSPNSIELCTAINLEAVNAGRGEHIQTLMLGH